MKIRTDFVTNSSSSSYVTINIKNPKLVELIRAAKRSHPAWERDTAGWEKIDTDESEQTVKMKVWVGYDIEDRLDAGLPPEHLDDLPDSLSKLLENISEYPFPDYDLAALRGALKENSREIAASTESADWTYDVEGYGEAALYQWYWDLVNHIAEKENLDYKPSSPGGCISFHYDKENGESHEENFSYDKPRSNSADDDFGDNGFQSGGLYYDDPMIDSCDEDMDDEGPVLESVKFDDELVLPEDDDWDSEDDEFDLGYDEDDLGDFTEEE